MMDPIVLEEASSSTAGHGGGGGRAIDRHNPIIRDEKRLGQGLILPSGSPITITTPDRSPHHQKKKSSKETSKNNHKPAVETGDQKRKSIAFADDDHFVNIENITGPAGDFIGPPTSSRYLLSDNAMLNFSSEFDTIFATPPPPPPPPPQQHEPLKSHDGKALKKKGDDSVSYAAPKSAPPPPPPLKFHDGDALKKKYDDSPPCSPPRPQPPPSPPREPLKFLNDKPLKKKDDDSLSSSPPKPPSPGPPPSPEPLQFRNREAVNKKDDGSLSFAPPQPPPSPRSSDQQVVVLEVSLHCRGCERKMRKHLSKIQGVRSFKIDFVAKKVTVVGDVTPLAVLTSVLKVKSAKLLTPVTLASSSN